MQLGHGDNTDLGYKRKNSRIHSRALSAPFPLRCAALVIDYMVLLLFPVLARACAIHSDTGVPDAIESTVWTLGVCCLLSDLSAAPIFFNGHRSERCRRIRIVKPTDACSSYRDPCCGMSSVTPCRY